MHKYISTFPILLNKLTRSLEILIDILKRAIFDLYFQMSYAFLKLNFNLGANCYDCGNFMFLKEINVLSGPDVSQVQAA